jgi:hypothetical protein
MLEPTIRHTSGNTENICGSAERRLTNNVATRIGRAKLCRARAGMTLNRNEEDFVHSATNLRAKYQQQKHREQKQMDTTLQYVRLSARKRDYAGCQGK